MKPVTTFAEAHAALRPLYNNARTKYDLEIMRQLMDFLGNPQNKLKIVHVAGTSGKTSTAYYVSALLEAAGARVGLTVSPHVDEVNERVQINRVPLPEAEFCNELTEFLGLVKQSSLAPSYFEAMVAFAYWVFEKKQVDYAVVEVGLGGLLDGTNVVHREDKVCVITDIGLDHTEVLGNSIEQIAAQKAGIIQSNNHVFMYKQGPEVLAVVENVCVQQSASLVTLADAAAVRVENLPLFQERNLGLAKEVADYVLQRDDRQQPTQDQITEAANTYIPARMERFELGNKVLLVDGSHNAQKLAALADSIRAAYPSQKVAALVAFVQGNDSRWQGGVELLMALADRIIVTSFQVEQDVPKASVDPGIVAAYCRSHGFKEISMQPNARSAFSELKQSAQPVLLVAGSFYLLNHIRPLIVN